MIDYKDYPPNWWTEIRPRILARAGEVLADDGMVIIEARCEWCAAQNRTEVCRDRNGVWHHLADVDSMNAEVGYQLFGNFNPKRTKIILTIAHLDHDKHNHAVQDNRLAALCQQCHLNYDRPHHLAVQRANRERRKGPLLFDEKFPLQEMKKEVTLSQWT